MDNMQYVYDDGGRSEAGFKGTTGDCFVRAVAIATQRPYREVYEDVGAFCSSEKRRKRVSHPRTGVYVETAKAYLSQRGWVWVPTMKVGSGCTTHLKAEELPSGIVICRLSKHYATVVNGTLRDSYDCSRSSTRCVYGYWIRKDRQRSSLRSSK